MSRRSRSPRRRAPEGDSSPKQSGYSTRAKPSRWNDEDRDARYPSSRDRDYKRSSRRDDDGPAPRDYDERRRERERERDRERYDSGRDRYGTSSRSHRRSASPPARGSRGREVGSRSQSREVDPSEDKSKPNFAPSGLLAAETNTVKAVDGSSTVLKYNEPPEARKPVIGWRLYVFKDAEQVGASTFIPNYLVDCIDEVLELLHIHRQSAYLVGRDRLVADIAIEHPSCSKQHAVFQCTCPFS